jgi:hypothetical protein
MIYIVDEDTGQMNSWADILKVQGKEAEIIGDADKAFEVLNKIQRVDLVCIDVMLAGDPYASDERFTREKTDEIPQTGILLLNDLCAQNPEVFPYRAVMLTQTSKPGIISELKKVCDEKHIPYWFKSTFCDANEFADAVIKRINILTEK